MAKNTGATCRISRRFGVDLDFKSRDIETKCKFKTPPGQHGLKRKKASEYSLQLNAKQMLRHKYLVLEKQFRRMYAEASRKRGATGVVLLQLLESRLDNVVYRMGFAVTRKEARQLVSHKTIMVNDVVVNRPSFQVQPGDVVKLTEKGAGQARVKSALELAAQKGFAEWVSVDAGKFLGEFKHVPDRDDLPTDINEQLVVELYSK